MSQPYSELPPILIATDGLTEHERHRLLADDRRRLALDILAAQSSPHGLDALAREIVRREDRRDAADGEVLTRVKIALHHKHLPHMDDIDVIDYDPITHRVTR